jgi:hypothetical protein
MKRVSTRNSACYEFTLKLPWHYRHATFHDGAEGGKIWSSFVMQYRLSTFLVIAEDRVQASRSCPCRRSVTRSPRPRTDWSSCTEPETWTAAVGDPCCWSMHRPGGCGLLVTCTALSGAELNWLATQLGDGVSMLAYATHFQQNGWHFARANWISCSFIRYTWTQGLQTLSHRQSLIRVSSWIRAFTAA